MMQAIRAFFIVFLCVAMHLRAELYWWAPKVTPGLAGYIDQYQVAINNKGLAITCFDGKIFGSYDVSSNQWSFCKLNTDTENACIEAISGYSPSAFSSEPTTEATSIAINDSGEGVALFKISSGVHVGKIGALHYKNNQWGSFSVLSEEAGMLPTIAQTHYGKAVCVWINQNENSSYQNCLMGTYFDGSGWESPASISDRKSVEMSYHQKSPQIQVSEIGDAVVVWKSIKEGDSLNGELLACSFDGVEDKWLGTELVGEQSLDKKGFSLSMNGRGDAVTVWEVEGKIKSAFFNICHHIIKTMNASSSQEYSWASYSNWVTSEVAEGEDMGSSKVMVDEQGGVLAVWLNGYSGVCFAEFSLQENQWKNGGSIYGKASYDVSLQKAPEGNVYALFISEGDALDELIYSRVFNSRQKSWGALETVVSTQNSLIDTVEICSIATNEYGIMMWYDFFKEQLFYSVLRQGREPLPAVVVEAQEKPHKKNNRLYQKKKRFTDKRAKGRKR